MQVHGYTWDRKAYDGRDLPVFIGPLSARCGSCDSVTPIIDTGDHGFDGEQGESSTASRPLVEARATRAKCCLCGCRDFALIARFEYLKNSERLGEIIPQAAGREHDFFSWFTLAGRCRGCGETVTIADFECA